MKNASEVSQQETAGWKAQHRKVRYHAFLKEKPEKVICVVEKDEYGNWIIAGTEIVNGQRNIAVWDYWVMYARFVDNPVSK